MISFKTTYGIEKCHPNELAPEFYRMTNCWRGTLDGKHVTVFAGALRHNPDKGVLILRTLPADSRRIGGRQCTIPAGSGALEITEVRGNRLRIAMANGGCFWFELPASLRQVA